MLILKLFGSSIFKIKGGRMEKFTHTHTAYIVDGLVAMVSHDILILNNFSVRNLLKIIPSFEKNLNMVWNVDNTSN